MAGVLIRTVVARFDVMPNWRVLSLLSSAASERQSMCRGWRLRFFRQVLQYAQLQCGIVRRFGQMEVQIVCVSRLSANFAPPSRGIR